MKTSFALSAQADFLTGTYASGHTTIALVNGAELIAQSMKVGMAVEKGSLWFNLSYGLDKQNLFYNTNSTEEELYPLRALAIKEFMRTFEGVQSIEGEPIFTRDDRTLYVTAPCAIVNCEHSTKRIRIGELNVC